jgi:hypothetical protein
VLPHPEVLTMFGQKAADHDRWITGMRRYQRSLGQRSLGQRSLG